MTALAAAGAVVALLVGWLVARRSRTAPDATPTDGDRRALEHRELEEQLAVALRASGMATWHWDLQTNAVDWNEMIRALFGQPPGTVVPTFDDSMRYIHPDDIAPLKARLARSITTGEDYTNEVRIVWPDGSVRTLAARGALSRDASGRPARMLGVCWDITAQKAADEALRASEERYRGLVQSQQDLVFRFDLAERVTFANDAYCARFGLTREEVLGNGLTHLHPDDREATTAAIAGLFQPPHVGMLENRIRTPEGWRWVSWSGCAIKDATGRVVEIQCVGRDVTERHAAEEKLHASLRELRLREERLRLLGQRLVRVRDDERRRLGVDLHDGVCQDLAGIAMLVGSLRQRLPAVEPDVAVTIAQAGRYIQTVCDHLRDLAHELRPMLLDDIGLEGSLRALADGCATGATQVRVAFTTPITRLDEAVETAVYRIAQEALANAVRHAGAAVITVTLGVASTVELEVRDDGRGFDASEALRMHSLGLVSIEERALAVGGALSVTSTPGSGTVVRFSCPRRAPAAVAGAGGGR